MKLGVIGLGSIGQRHAGFLLKAGAELHALRTMKGAKPLPEALAAIHVHRDENEFFSLPLDGCVIANPTSLHAAALGHAISLQRPVFVEKPLAGSLAELNGVVPDVEVMVGYNLRHHPLIRTVREHLPRLGSVRKANLYCGQYLPLWHPYTDYRNEYYSRNSLGGGALRTLSHELDLALHLVSKPQQMIGVVDRLSDLEIDVDDHAQVLLRCGSAVINVEINFLDPRSLREGVLMGTNGALQYSFATGTVQFWNLQGRCEDVQLVADTDSYEEQMRVFMRLLEGHTEAHCTYCEGLEILRIIEQAEQQHPWRDL